MKDMRCRVCKSERLIKYDTIEDNILDVTAFLDKPVFGKGNTIEFFCCPDCGHFQIKGDRLAEAYYNDYHLVYNPNASSNASAGYPKSLMEYYRKYFTKLDKILSRKHRVLDVGCAAGDMLFMLQDLFEEVVGIEPSVSLYRAARAKNLNVVHGYFGLQSNFEEKFDCITALMVLEHIEELSEFMQALYNNLNEDGVVMLNVPNGRKIVQEQSYYDVFLEHINYFTLDSLMYLSEHYGFEVISIEEGFVDGFHLTAILRKKKKCLLFSDKKRQEMQQINALIQNYGVIGVWGIGVRARNILNLIEDANIRIKYLFDNNEGICGKYIYGSKQPIMKPDRSLICTCELIIITSFEYYDEIIGELREKYDYVGKIIYIKNGIYVLI